VVRKCLLGMPVCLCMKRAVARSVMPHLKPAKPALCSCSSLDAGACLCALRCVKKLERHLEAHESPLCMYLLSQVRADSALQGIGRPVDGVPSRGQPVQNPVARTFSNSISEAVWRSGGGLLSGHVSSTEITQRPEEGTPPRTAAEALAAMQARLAAESPATHPQTTDFSSPKAPDTQVPPLLTHLYYSWRPCLQENAAYRSTR
jgi:hypothetical protein